MRRSIVIILGFGVLLAGCVGVLVHTVRAQRATVPSFAHVVVVVLENHGYDEVIGNPDAPYLNSLARSGALLTNSYGVTHPSEPNYLALFSGSTQGLANDSCPHTYRGPNLGSALLSHGRTFVGFAEDLPRPGFTGCSNRSYLRAINPWVDFAALPADVSQPATAFPHQFDRLPSVAFLIPNLRDDMHYGTVAHADNWLRRHLGGYVAWARTHDSLLVITTDEDDRGGHKPITTIIAGAHVRPGRYGMRADHYTLLRTLLDSFRIPPFAAAGSAVPLTTIWER